MSLYNYVTLDGLIWEHGAFYGRFAKRRKNENVAINGNSLLYNCKQNVVVVPEGKLAVLQDLEGYLVAATDNVVCLQKR